MATNRRKRVASSKTALLGVALTATVLLVACSNGGVGTGAVEIVGAEVEETRPVADDSPPRPDTPPVLEVSGDRVVLKEGHVSLQHQARRPDGSFVGAGIDVTGDEVRQWFQSGGGLQWTPLEVAGLPDGRVLGFSEVDGTYHAAIDELNIPSSGLVTLEGREPDPFAPLEAQQVNITLWESNDAESWRPSERYQNFSGQAARLYFVDFHSDGWSTSMNVLRSELPENSRLVDYLSSDIDEPTARATCYAQRMGRGTNSTLELYDCDETLIVSLAGDEGESKHLKVDCIRRNLWQDMNPSTFAFFGSDDALFLEPPGFDSGWGGRIAGSESWVFNDRWPNVNLAPVCQTPTDRERQAGIELNRWDASTEAFVQIPVPPEANRLLDASVVPAPDGSLVLVSQSQVWETDNLGATWTLRIDHPTWVPGQANPHRGVGTSRDGQVAIAHEPGLIHVELRPGLWTAIPFEGPHQFAHIKSVTDEYVFIGGLHWGSRELRVQR